MNEKVLTLLMISSAIIGITGMHIANHRFPPLRTTTTDASPNYVFIFIVICFISAIIMFAGLVYGMYKIEKNGL